MVYMLWYILYISIPVYEASNSWHAPYATDGHSDTVVFYVPDSGV